MDLNIRLAQKDDAQVIRQFILDLADYQRTTSAVTVNVELLESQLNEAKPPFECLIAELNGVAVGFALFYNNYSTWEGKPGIYLEDLYVQPDARLYGIGRKLIVKLCQLALERECTRLDWSVQSTNFKAVKFYSVLGASPMPEWIKWRLDEHSMQELLNTERETFSQISV